MPEILRTTIIATALLLSAVAGAHDHRAEGPEPLGKVHFDNSCSPAVAAEFDQGVSLLHSFWYDEARRAFANVAKHDPKCVIAYWGLAMGYFQAVEHLPRGDEQKHGQQAIDKANKATRATPRERAYVNALTEIYNERKVPNRTARAQNYSDAMQRLSAQYAEDHEASLFYALSLLNPELPDDPDLLRSGKALTILNDLLKTEPDNPGIVHYIIHASDHPRLAQYGLDAARRYAQVAPASAHALHMPGHIFARLGLWEDDLRSNLASKAAAESRSSLHIGAENRLHAMEFLEYAYLQTGKDAQAAAIATEAATVRAEELNPGFEGYYESVEASFPARFALEMRDWAGAVALQRGPGKLAQGCVVTYWAQAVGAGHLRDARSAANAQQRYRSCLLAEEQVAQQKSRATHWVEVNAWTEFAQGDIEAALTLMRPLCDHQDKVGKGEVEIPAREMMGDMLLLAGRAREALAEYKVSLQTDPGRFNTLLHAGEAAQSLGLNDEATGYYRALLQNAPDPSPLSNDALRKAREFLVTWRSLPPAQ